MLPEQAPKGMGPSVLSLVLPSSMELMLAYGTQHCHSHFCWSKGCAVSWPTQH